MYKKILSFLLWVSLFFFFTLPIDAHAHEITNEKVRVGYVPADAFFYKDADGQFQGLYAEYLYTISQYTDWDYEFVSGSMDSLLNMLSTGQIDMLLNVNYTPEYRAICFFPNYPVTMQQLCCVVHPSDENFPNSNLFNLNGKKVGSISDTYSETALLNLIRDKNLKCTYYPCLDYKSLMYSFTAGAIDAIVLNISDVDDSQKILSIIDINDLYLAVSKLRPDILAELNKTLRSIYLKYPHYNSDLYKKYVTTDGKNYAYSVAATNYIKNASTLKVVYIQDNAPFEYMDETTHTFQGIAGAYFSSISKQSSLQFEFIPAKTYSEALNMLDKKEADLISSVYSDTIYAKSHSLSITDAYYNLGLSLVRKNESALDSHLNITVALPKTSIGFDSYLHKSYPEMDFLFYDNMEACIEAVRSGNSDAAILPSQTASIFLQQHYYSDIVVSTGLQLSIPTSIGIRDDLPPDLLTVLNHAIKAIPYSEKNNIQIANMVQTTYSVPFLNVLAANMIPLLVIILVTVSLIIAAIIFQSRKRYQKVLSVSETDLMTGIYNKISAETRIRHYLDTRPKELCALYIIDIDYFKSINDTFGHKYGDIIIKDAAELIRRTFSEHDIVGRMGGDEFIVLQINRTSTQEISDYGQKLSSLLNREYHFSSKQNCQLSASIGVAIYDNGNYTYDELIECADKTLYEVKKEGRNNFKIAK